MAYPRNMSFASGARTHRAGPTSGDRKPSYERLLPKRKNQKELRGRFEGADLGNYFRAILLPVSIRLTKLVRNRLVQKIVPQSEIVA